VKNPTLRARVDADLFARVQACVDAYNRGQEPGMPEMDQGGVMRVLLIHGLPWLEAKLGIKPPPKPAPGEPPAPAKRTAKKSAKRTKSG
jgi:hypothetical protein